MNYNEFRVFIDTIFSSSNRNVAKVAELLSIKEMLNNKTITYNLSFNEKDELNNYINDAILSLVA